MVEAIEDRSAWSAERGVDAGWMREADAIAVALSGSRLARLRVGGGALFRLLRNPDDTVQVFLLGIALNGPHLPALLERLERDPEGARLLVDQPSIDSKSVDYEALARLPESTLGGAYARWMRDKRLDPDLFRPPPGLPPVARYVAQRIRQSHDLWHVLTGYATDVPGEVALQAFTYAQLGMPSAWVIAVLGTLTRAPRSAPRVLEAYRRGRRARWLPPVRFEAMWELPLEEVRSRLGIAPEGTA